MNRQNLMEETLLLSFGWFMGHHHMKCIMVKSFKSLFIVNSILPHIHLILMNVYCILVMKDIVVLILVGINAFLALFWAYAGQPGDHKGLAILIPFISIHSIYPRTNPYNFQEKILRIGGVKKRRFFDRASLNFLFKKIFFASFLWKSVKIYRLEWIGLNFDDYPGFQLKLTHAN